MLGLNPTARDSLRSLGHLNPDYIFDSSEVVDEYNLLNTFLSNSLLNDGPPASRPPDGVNLGPLGGKSAGSSSDLKEQAQSCTTRKIENRILADKGLTSTKTEMIDEYNEAQEKYYFFAAYPAETGSAEKRMGHILVAKYGAGMLKPFNYVNGYARLNQYMDRYIRQQSRQRILRQLNRFRPKFRERMQRLTDIELVMVEMWFERILLDYERIFASMAVPACCWRRTGEVCRGNREMAEALHVDIDKLRDVRRREIIMAISLFLLGSIKHTRIFR